MRTFSDLQKEIEQRDLKLIPIIKKSNSAYFYSFKDYPQLEILFIMQLTATLSLSGKLYYKCKFKYFQFHDKVISLEDILMHSFIPKFIKERIVFNLDFFKDV